MADPSLSAFQDPDGHARIAAIIRRRSSNPEDVRRVLLRGLDLQRVRDVLDLGCGFGFVAEAVAPRVARDACITGVDACPANEAPFRQRVESSGRQARFFPLLIERSLPWPDACFDLVLGCYSLYFFPDVVGEVARVLRAQGLFLVLTHSERSFTELVRASGLDPRSSPLMTLVRRFSAENGAGKLARHFGQVERIDYPNALRFPAEDCSSVATYLRFKLPLMNAMEAGESDLPAPMRSSIERWMRAHGALVVTKDDTGFHCRRPRPGEA